MSFLQYAMSVIVGRALPDVKDGLKPVHRRILYAMNDLGLVPTKPYRHAAASLTSTMLNLTLQPPAKTQGTKHKLHSTRGCVLDFIWVDGVSICLRFLRYI